MTFFFAFCAAVSLFQTKHIEMKTEAQQQQKNIFEKEKHQNTNNVMEFFFF